MRRFPTEELLKQCEKQPRWKMPENALVVVCVIFILARIEKKNSMYVAYQILVLEEPFHLEQTEALWKPFAARTLHLAKFQPLNVIVRTAYFSISKTFYLTVFHFSLTNLAEVVVWMCRSL